jgi:D-glycero-D-manno-heptose 1,7-bisphosphate phosphatase
MAKNTKRAVFLDRDGVLVVPEMRDGRSYAPRSLDASGFTRRRQHCSRD